MLPATFYKEFRASFLNNLRKKDEPIGTRKPGAKLKEEKVLSPSFGDAIILWTLEKIDPRLPMKVSKEYEHRLGQGTYLSDLHSSIFQAIPSMIENLDQVSRRAIRTQPDVEGRGGAACRGGMHHQARQEGRRAGQGPQAGTGRKSSASSASWRGARPRCTSHTTRGTAA